MWASNCVYFLSFLCPTQSPQSSALCSGPSWKFLFSWTRGQDCPCWADFIPPDLTMDELCCYINIYFSHVSPPPFFYCHFNHIPLGQSATGRVRLCVAVCVRYRWLCVADQWVPWLTLTLHLVWEKPVLYTLYFRLAGEPTHFCMCPTQAVHSWEADQISSSKLYIHCKWHILCLYFDLAMWMAGSCLHSSLFTSCVCWRCNIFLTIHKHNLCLNLCDQREASHFMFHINCLWETFVSPLFTAWTISSVLFICITAKISHHGGVYCNTLSRHTEQ